MKIMPDYPEGQKICEIYRSDDNVPARYIIYDKELEERLYKEILRWHNIRKSNSNATDVKQ
jgi:hypothetical protein